MQQKIKKELTAAQRTLLEKEATIAKLNDQIEEEKTVRTLLISGFFFS